MKSLYNGEALKERGCEFQDKIGESIRKTIEEAYNEGYPTQEIEYVCVQAVRTLCMMELACYAEREFLEKKRLEEERVQDEESV